MRRAIIFVHRKRAGVLTEIALNDYHFDFDENYEGETVSLKMPVKHKNIVINLSLLFWRAYNLKLSFYKDIYVSIKLTKTVIFLNWLSKEII